MKFSRVEQFINFFNVTCIKFCEWAKNWKISLLYLSSFYLLEPFTSKQTISIIILIFVHVDLNFLHVKIAPFKIILMYMCVYVSCRMGQPLGSSIIMLLFLSIAVQFNHTFPTIQKEENNPRHLPRKKETPGKVLGKIRSRSYKIV